MNLNICSRCKKQTTFSGQKSGGIRVKWPSYIDVLSLWVGWMASVFGYIQAPRLKCVIQKN